MFIRKKKARTMIWAAAGMLVFGTSAAMTSAYFTSTDRTLTNILTPGTVSEKLTETDWEETSGWHMLPGEQRKKNPVVHNTGTLDAWMFLEVEIPVRTISLVDLQTHRKQPEARTELFTFEANEGWELLDRTEETDCVRYIYGYQEIVAPLQETASLFDTITAVPYLEGSLDFREVWKIPVTAKAIQKNIAPEGTGLKELYQIYLEQQTAERSAET